MPLTQSGKDPRSACKEAASELCPDQSHRRPIYDEEESTIQLQLCQRAADAEYLDGTTARGRTLDDTPAREAPDGMNPQIRAAQDLKQMIHYLRQAPPMDPPCRTPPLCPHPRAYSPSTTGIGHPLPHNTTNTQPDSGWHS